MDAITGSLCKALATQSVKLFFGAVTSNIEKKSKDKSIEEKMWANCERKMSSHLLFASNWGSHLKALGMYTAEELPEKTIDLRYDAIPRTYSNIAGEDEHAILSEKHLLNASRNIIILGEPGSGKTTTLQRIATQVLSGAVAEDFAYQYPIVIPLRKLNLDLDNHSPIINYISDEFGFSPYVTVSNVGKSSFFEATSADGKKLLKDYVCAFLNETQALVLIDGLDEVADQIRHRVYEEIDFLSGRLERSKIFLTCRTGELIRNFAFFDTLNICPLNTQEVKNIAYKWLKNNTDSFLNDLSQKTYYDLSSKPMFLFFLIRLSRGGNSLPELACYVYQDIVDLAIRDWDQERNITRSSKYANFEPSRKRNFLCKFSYELTYRVKANSFSLKEFKEIYEKICDSYGLPREDVKLVASEIESHTGIIADIGRGEYEFTHLTIQEYLCAEHLSKSMIDIIGYTRYLKSRPNPLAICVALSATPSAFFCTLLMHEALYNQTNIKNVNIFLNRINLESPQFETDANLGIAILYLLNKKKASQNSELANNINALLHKRGAVTKSVENSLYLYCLDQSDWESGICRLYLNRVYESEYRIIAPEELYIERQDFEKILCETHLSLDFLFNNSI